MIITGSKLPDYNNTAIQNGSQELPIHLAGEHNLTKVLLLLLQLFDRLRKENPGFELKMKPVEGDMMEPWAQ